MDTGNQRKPDARAAGASQPQTTCEGVVMAVHGPTVMVKVDAPKECEGCASKGACHLAGMGGNQVEVEAQGFAPGDRVRIITYSKAIVRASIVLYLFPALLVLIGSFAGFFTIEAFTSWDGNIGSFIGVVVGLVIGILFVHFYKVAAGDGGFDLRLEKIN